MMQIHHDYEKWKEQGQGVSNHLTIFEYLPDLRSSTGSKLFQRYSEAPRYRKQDEGRTLLR